MQIPLTLVALITLGVVLGSIYAGYGLYRLLKQAQPDSIIEPSGTAVGALMGLLAFMLAFAFGMGANRLENRKEALLTEINAIGTLNLRADILPAERREEYKALIKEYVKLRLDLQSKALPLEEALSRADEMSHRIWSIASEHSTKNKTGVDALLLVAANDVIDSYEARVFHGLQHIPIVIWGALISMSVLAMLAMGYQFGPEKKMSHVVNILVALTFAGALMLIADYDRYDAGFFQIPNMPMMRLYLSL